MSGARASLGPVLGGPQLIRDRHAAGEFSFVAQGVYLSFQLSQSLALELATSDGLWKGRSFRGDVKVMLPGERRIFRHKVPAHFAHVTIPESLHASLDGSPSRLRPHTLLSDVPLRYVIEAWLAEGAAGGAPSRLFADGALQAILARLATLKGGRLAPPPGRMPPHLFKRAVDLIEAKLDQDVSIATLAQVCGLSVSHFTSLFRASAGEPPHRYQTRRRVERARDLLLSGETPAAAALAVGFCDQSHLARHMRRLTGYRPSHWRRMSAERPLRKRNVL